MRLQGKVAFITGGSHGIGRGIAERLARDGADVAFNYGHDDAGAAATVAAIEAAGRKSAAIRADMLDLAAIREMLAEAERRLGTPGILVNNAGVEHKADFWNVTEADYDRVLSVNLKGLFFSTQAFVNQLRAAGRPGTVINISSVHEDLPFPGFSTYCASKGAVRMLTRDLAVELGPLGITVNAIAPGAIETPINTKLLNSPELLKALTDKIPLGRLGKPEDVAGLAAFLASPDAAYVTGATYFIDGGLTWSYHEQ
ncbi:SDR family NAD(P)-dependent oxidoreductase [Zavarzinella formosa]|uniref:SDR family NAD(P)-dependent oxidoreductase n=1 Tax=Zavarzinella formosa TaxID=360055 RepID=UPI0002E4BDE0|nr:glucose 1-dehydrogenase [Zavarzinella formosa]